MLNGKIKALRQQARIELMLLLVLILAIAAVFVIRTRNAPQVGISIDDAEYIVLAESFAEGQAFRRINFPDAPPQTVYPFGYSLFVLALPVKLFGSNPTVIRLINLLLLVGSALAGYRLLRFKYARPIVLASVLSLLINPRVVGQASVAMSDIAFTFFILLWLLLFQLESGNRQLTLRYLTAIIVLAIGVLVRYWGVAFIGAAVISLLLERQYRKLLALIVGLAVIGAPFLFILARLQSEAPADSYLALQAVTGSLQHYVENIRLSAITYPQAIPLMLIPLVGPQVLALLGNIGLSWLAAVFNLLIVLIVVVGFALSIKKWRFIALSVASYFAMIVVLTHHHGQAVVFNEPRYLIPIALFLYAYLFDGLSMFLGRLFRPEMGKRLIYVAAAGLLLFMFWRNQQQASAVFPVADLSAGNAWVQENTDVDAVFMAPDPVGRYLYLRRHTVEYPVEADIAEITAELDKWSVTHVLQAPPLLLDGSANVEQLADENVTAAIENLRQSYPKCLEIVFEDVAKKTTILEVDQACFSR